MSRNKRIWSKTSSTGSRWRTWLFLSAVCAIHIVVSFLILSEMAGFSQDFSAEESEQDKSKSKHLYMRVKTIDNSQHLNNHEIEKEEKSESETEDEDRNQVEEYLFRLQSTIKSRSRLKPESEIKSPVQNSRSKKLFSALKIEENARENTLETSANFNLNLISNWKTIKIGRDFELHVYSSYYDVALKQILIIGGSEKKNREKLRIKCCFHFQIDEKSEPLAGAACPLQTEAKIQEMEEQKIFTHSTFFIKCPFDEKSRHDNEQKTSKLPKFVTLDLDFNLSTFQNDTLKKSSSFPHKNLGIPIEIQIQYPWQQGQRFGRQVDLSICLKPLHSNLNQPLRFLEWLEFYRLMGVEKFTLYAQNPNPDLLCILKFYEDLGIVELLPWDIPFPVITSEDAWNRDRFNYGQSGAQNDCLYRHRGSSKFVAFIDMDEFIMPQNPWENLTQLLHDMNPADSNFGAFIIQSTFFFLNWRDDEEIAGLGFQGLNTDEKALARKLVVVRKTKRKTQTYPHGSWSKPICNPEGVRQVGVHIVHELMDGYKKLRVPSAKALLHHYRKCDRYLGGETLTSRYVINRRMHTFAPDLVRKLSGKIKLLKNACPSVKFE